ncbi:hypothetical protein ACM0CQ_02765 [Mycobacteroides abscessus subsp. abscessus]|uniref:hypothetical protein n=1 Tax=Mycobacteroides abscessus TaxID=36809 RepID=UPI0039EF5D49
MAGSADNVKLWPEANVYVFNGSTTFDPATHLPATIADPFPAGTGSAPLWTVAGMLNGDAGFEESREWDESDVKAWGYGVIKVASKDYKDERKWTALEDNKVTYDLLWPGSTDTQIVVPKPALRYIAFELKDDEGRIERYISATKARHWAQNVNKKEGSVEGYEFTSRIFPKGDFSLYLVQKGIPTP